MRKGYKTGFLSMGADRFKRVQKGTREDVGYMEFKELFNPLKKCLGDGHNRQYFFRDLMAMITTVSEKEWGTPLDPNTKRTNDNTIFSFIKRGLSQTFAQSIVNRLTPEVLEERINDRPHATREALAQELSIYMDDIDANNVGSKAADMMVRIITKSAGLMSDDEVVLGKEEIESSKRKLEQMKNTQKEEIDSAKRELERITNIHKEEIESSKHELEQMKNTQKIEIESVRQELESMKTTYSETDEKNDIDESDEITAKAFLMDHETERELIPLCQVAALYSPEHKHVRTMYNRFILLPKRIQKHILKSCDAEKMSYIDSLHTSEAVDFFCKDLERFELSSKRYLYVFGQYLYRAFYSYSKCSIDKYDNYSFIRLCKSSLKVFENTGASIDSYIDDYLWMKDKNIKSEALPPMDYLWIEKDFGSCKEEELTYWLCRFVIGVCNNLFYRINKTDLDLLFVDDQYAETQEDLYYCVLHALYNLYLSHTAN